MTGDPTVSARALASRRNGARSRGPGTAAGKARSARNALKHGLCARTLLLDDEDAAALPALASAARVELAPEGALQAELVTRIVAAAWRARRADRLEAALLNRRHLAEQPGDPQAALGYGLMRDGHGPRALETLVRYRGAVLAELFRALAALKARQAEPATSTRRARAPRPFPRAYKPSRRPRVQPNEPEEARRTNDLSLRPRAGRPPDAPGHDELGNIRVTRHATLSQLRPSLRGPGVRPGKPTPRPTPRSSGPREVGMGPGGVASIAGIRPHPRA